MKDRKEQENTEQMKLAGKEMDDGLNLEDHRLPQDYANLVGVKKAIVNIPVRKPRKQEFFRVHSDSQMSFEIYALKLEEENEFYTLKMDLLNEVADHVFPIVLYTGINRAGDPFLWPIKLAGPDGKLNSWPQSELQAAKIAQERWIRLNSNRSLGSYDVVVALDKLPDPQWPDMDFQQLFRIAFKNHNIDDRNHQVLKELRGEL